MENKDKEGKYSDAHGTGVLSSMIFLIVAILIMVIAGIFFT